MNQHLPFSLTKVSKTKTCRCRHQVNWNYRQLCQYALYLHTFLQENTQQPNRRLSSKQFANMSKMIGSRNINQCRIFHSKMLQIHCQLQDLFKMFTENIKQYPSIWARYNENRIKGELGPQRNLEPIFQQPQDEILKKKDNEQQPTGNLYQAIQLNPPIPFIKNLSQSEYHRSVKMDWFDEFDGFLDDINGQWLDDI